jgi:hypothetical protein
MEEDEVHRHQSRSDEIPAVVAVNIRPPIYEELMQ